MRAHAEPEREVASVHRDTQRARKVVTLHVVQRTRTYTKHGVSVSRTTSCKTPALDGVSTAAAVVRTWLLTNLIPKRSNEEERGQDPRESCKSTVRRTSAEDDSLVLGIVRVRGKSDVRLDAADRLNLSCANVKLHSDAQKMVDHRRTGWRAVVGNSDDAVLAEDARSKAT